MKWYQVDIEILIIGKTTEYIQADNKETAEFIALKKVINEFGCSKNEILSTSSKKISRK